MSLAQRKNLNILNFFNNLPINKTLTGQENIINTMVSGKCNSTWRLNVIQQQNPFNYIPFPQQWWITKNKSKRVFLALKGYFIDVIRWQLEIKFVSIPKRKTKV